MFFSNQHVTPPNVSIDVNGYLVAPKAYVKYLGLHLTRKLNWNYYIMTKCNKIKETVFNILEALLGLTGGLTETF